VPQHPLALDGIISERGCTALAAGAMRLSPPHTLPAAAPPSAWLPVLGAFCRTVLLAA
jgi:hypothetical protein